MQFVPSTKQGRLASLQAAKPQQPTSRTKGAALQMPPSEALSLYLWPEVLLPACACYAHAPLARPSTLCLQGLVGW